MKNIPAHKKYFALGLLIGAVTGLWVYYLAFLFQAGNRPPCGSAKHTAIIKRKTQEAGAISNKKLLLVGGSSVGLGISAKLLSQELGIPVYNFSFWASLGAPYILHLAKQVLREGDVVLLCLEYEILDWKSPFRYWSDTSFIRFVMSVDPDFILSKPLEEKVCLAISQPPSSILSGLTSWRRGQETASFDLHKEFNEFGDSLSPDKFDKNDFNKFKERVSMASEIYAEGISSDPKASREVGEFLQWADKRGIIVLATFPNLAFNQFYTSENAKAAGDAVKNIFQPYGVKILGTPEEAMFPQEFYLDTNYHLTEEGVKRRTEKFLPIISVPLFSPSSIAP